MGKRLTDQMAVIEQEVRRWPGVEVHFQKPSRGHPRVIVAFGGASRFVVISGSHGDKWFAARHALGDVRRELKRLGASRACG